MTFDEWFSTAYVNQRLNGPLANHMRAAWDACFESCCTALEEEESKTKEEDTEIAPSCMWCGSKLLPALACPTHGFYGDPPTE